MDQAGGRDELVRRIAGELEREDRPTDSQSNRPGVDARQRAYDLGIVEIDVDPPRIGELRNLPENDTGDAAGVTGQQRCFLRIREPASAWIRI